MKKIKILLVVILFSALHAGAQTIADDVEQLVLDYEKLSQLKDILNNMYKGYTIVSNGYNSIKNVAQGNFSLHQGFLDGLLAVSPAVKNYKHVADIIQMQGTLVSEYKSAFNRFKQDKNFDADEIGYLSSVYTNLFNQSLNDLDELTTILTGGKTRMSDDERLHSIDNIYANSSDKLAFLRQFNKNTSILAIQRAKNNNDLTTVSQLYGVK